ncbi:Flp family type IVb pilin [Hirschia maritima]|uniref:Flp family type IVb pilin n=1 Tax=Hirschia maritima TaxID=1121961 RepID=UPI0003689233|nr:Flp family type IVb pilin [Hirschia maritima]
MFGKKVRNLFKQVWSDRSGATAIEYGLMASLIAVAIITGARVMGEETGDGFENLGEKWQEAVDSQNT